MGDRRSSQELRRHAGYPAQVASQPRNLYPPAAGAYAKNAGRTMVEGYYNQHYRSPSTSAYNTPTDPRMRPGAHRLYTRQSSQEAITVRDNVLLPSPRPARAASSDARRNHNTTPAPPPYEVSLTGQLVALAPDRPAMRPRRVSSSAFPQAASHSTGLGRSTLTSQYTHAKAHAMGMTGSSGRSTGLSSNLSSRVSRAPRDAQLQASTASSYTAPLSLTPSRGHRAPHDSHCQPSPSSYTAPLPPASTAIQPSSPASPTPSSTIFSTSSMSEASPSRGRRTAAGSSFMDTTNAPTGGHTARRSSSGSLDADMYAANTRSSSLASSTHHEPPPLNLPPPGHGIAGLVNLGNTCFMNSMLQCLMCVPHMQDAVRSKKVNWRSDASVAPSLVGMIGHIGARPLAVFKPSSFLRRMGDQDTRWTAGAQQDSQEFLTSLLSTLQRECNRNSSTPKYRELRSTGSVREQAREAADYSRLWTDSFVDDLFGGQLQSTITCRDCNHASHRFDPFCDISLPIVASNRCSLSDCLTKFTEREELDDAYECPGCKATTRKVKQIRVYTPPCTLILVLKRFAAHSSSAKPSPLSCRTSFRHAQKNSAAVDVPASLQISNFCSPDGMAAARCSGKYELLAVSEHSGRSLGGGHYTATGCAASDGQWYRFNDSLVQEAACPQGPSSSAYVLFYRLVT